VSTDFIEDNATNSLANCGRLVGNERR